VCCAEETKGRWCEWNVEACSVEDDEEEDEEEDKDEEDREDDDPAAMPPLDNAACGKAGK
jgi:hypothetical protein